MNNLYAYATLLISITDWMPINAIECGCLLLILLGIAYIMVAFSFTAIDLDRRISLIMVLLITFVIILYVKRCNAVLSVCTLGKLDKTFLL